MSERWHPEQLAGFYVTLRQLHGKGYDLGAILIWMRP